MKVIIGISGGVDSSVAAYLLKEKGYEVIAITLRMLDDFDVTDAINVCKQLNIEHHIIDIREDFKNKIIDNFIKEYINGLTPNPCVLCNKEIKFKYLYDALIEYNADYIATGHYVKVELDKLYKGEDLSKDQSYFLYGIDKNIISKLIFPLQNITKEEVRNIANKINLNVANKKDSYDVCFIKDKFKEFISSNTTQTKGNVINIDTNEIIGTHNGLAYYTIGQRKGLNIGGNADKLYVVKKDIKNNILYVALNGENDNLYSSTAIIEKVNFNTNERPIKCNAKFRYRQNDNEVNITYLDSGNLLLKYDRIKSVTPGQSCVLYIDNRCIGGGIIKEVY